MPKSKFFIYHDGTYKYFIGILQFTIASKISRNKPKKVRHVLQETFKLLKKEIETRD